jgi:hypothetical protein
VADNTLNSNIIRQANLVYRNITALISIITVKRLISQFIPKPMGSERKIHYSLARHVKSRYQAFSGRAA